MVISKNKEILFGRNGSERSSTIYWFHRCKWHDCPCLRSANDKYRDTLSMESLIRSLGHNIVSVWECENLELTHLQKESVSYPYFIMYNFEALPMAFQSVQTPHLMLPSLHVPVSIKVNDNPTNDPTFLENGAPKTLIQLFFKELAHRQGILSKQAWNMYPINMLTACPNESEAGRWLG